MEKGINLATKELEMSLMQEISKANLPPVIVSSVLKNLLLQVQILEEKSIKQEHEEYLKAQEKINSKEVNNEKNQ